MRSTKAPCSFSSTPAQVWAGCCGPPASRLLESAHEVHLFLTHYHLDHVCGLAYLPALFAGRTLMVHVPDAALNGVDPQRGVPELIRKPYNPHAWSEQPGLVLRTLHDGVNKVAGHEVRLRAQCHPDTTVAYRLDDALVLATDTVADPETASFARGAEVLLHESWIDGIEEDDPRQADLVRTTYLFTARPVRRPRWPRRPASASSS